MTETVQVALGDRAYDIHIGSGLLDRAGDLVRPLVSVPRVAVIADAAVAPLHLPRLSAALDGVGIDHVTIPVPAGEGSKDMPTLARVLDALLETGLERRSVVIALGGGVVGDLAGFAAAVALRGIDFIQVPTTLLAQVDSAVGGKTGVNSRHGKNLIGAFHQPRLVLADLDTLGTLPDRELRAGYAEVVKYGAIDRPEFFDWLEDRGGAALAGDRDALAHAVAVSCRSKAAIVAADEREGGRRALLNLGHTFAHALEAECGYDGRLLHGEAVSIGMVLAHRLSVRLGLCPAADADRLEAHLTAAGLPVVPQQVPDMRWDVDRLMAHMARDKKVVGGRITFILTRGIGQAFVARDVDPAAARAVLVDALADTRVPLDGLPA